jgi:hypothetical protein
MKRHYKFRTLVDEDVQKKYGIRFPAQIEFYVTAYLNDPDGWSSKGYGFEPVSMNEDVLIRLSSPETIEEKCGLPSNLSCAELNGKHMYLNAERWFHGSKASKLSLDNYRQYMVSHEIGHILGFEHQKCPCAGCKAPIMMQQTLGIGKCIPNTKITNGRHD